MLPWRNFEPGHPFPRTWPSPLWKNLQGLMHTCWANTFKESSKISLAGNGGLVIYIKFRLQNIAESSQIGKMINLCHPPSPSITLTDLLEGEFYWPTSWCFYSPMGLTPSYRVHVCNYCSLFAILIQFFGHNTKFPVWIWKPKDVTWLTTIKNIKIIKSLVFLISISNLNRAVQTQYI